MKQVSIVGGGLVGALLAVFLRRRGNPVIVYEARPDPRVGPLAGGRSINLIVTVRGIHALRQVGLWQPVSKITSPVTGRMMHDRSGDQAYQPYGKDDSECNHSVSRGELNNLLLTAAENAGAELRFDHQLTAFDPNGNRMRFVAADGTEKESTGELVFGADGAASKVRAGLMNVDGAAESIDMLTHGYKELEFPAANGGNYAMDSRALHIWPRGGFMLMGLPNQDGSFTGTLYMPREGKHSFEDLTDAAAVLAFFEREFPDAVPLLPSLTSEFAEHPTGELGTVRCSPWHFNGGAALIGDAAHAIVPFFGQGMNAGFEDCTVLDELLERFDGDWERTLPAYDAARKPDADAIAEMALDNFVEMRERVGDPAFLLRKQVEHQLERAFPTEYRSRYSMVVYSRIPYAIAQQAGRIQAKLLDTWCAGSAPPTISIWRPRERRSVEPWPRSSNNTEHGSTTSRSWR
jgi:kynurenine 3-monooxygenase